MIQQLDHFRSQRQPPEFVSLAVDTHLRFGKQQIVPVESKHLARTEAVEKHQADNGQIACRAKTGPKLGHLFVG
jgi:hypothetical protein